jgi:hypothetical protein
MPPNKKSFPVWTINFRNHPFGFVDSCSQLFNYPQVEEYQQILQLDRWTPNDLERLFVWKNNNMTLSGKKNVVYKKLILPHLRKINELRTKFDIAVFDSLFQHVPAIWRIFLLHCIHPPYPIFDQHVYRAYLFFQGEKIHPLPYSQAGRMKIYRGEFLPFFKGLKTACPRRSAKQIDNALWAFGKFLKEHQNVI